MAKPSADMDLDEWEFLPNDTSFIDLALPHQAKNLQFNRRNMIHMDYFICPPDDSCPSPHALPPIKKKLDEDKEAHLFKDIGVVPPVIAAADRVAVPESEKLEGGFVDMETDPPPKSPMKEDEEIEKCVEVEKKGKNACEGFGVRIWRWRVNGIGTLCSIGVAAATICIVVLGGQQRKQQQQQYQNQRIQFQIYADDKRIKQVVQQASRFNQALSVVRGVPMARAHISFGGYYDGL